MAYRRQRAGSNSKRDGIIDELKLPRDLLAQRRISDTAFPMLA